MLLLFFLGSRVSIFSFREVPDQQPTTVKYLGEYNLQYVSASSPLHYSALIITQFTAELYRGRKLHWTAFLCIITSENSVTNNVTVYPRVYKLLVKN